MVHDGNFSSIQGGPVFAYKVSPYGILLSLWASWSQISRSTGINDPGLKWPLGPHSWSGTEWELSQSWIRSRIWIQQPTQPDPGVKWERGLGVGLTPNQMSLNFPMVHDGILALSRWSSICLQGVSIWHLAQPMGSWSQISKALQITLVGFAI